MSMMLGSERQAYLESVLRESVTEEFGIVSMNELTGLAENGDFLAAYELGERHFHGRGEFYSYEEAFRWYKEGAEKGHAPSQYRTGWMYEWGRGWGADRTNHKSALKWHTAAAEQGHAGSMYELGRMYWYGLGVPEDEDESEKWFRAAAELGNPDAQTEMGSRYYHEDSNPAEKEEAVRWFRAAADQGDPNGQTFLGLIYEEGFGVEQDLKEAIKWYRLAADGGSANAQYNLGMSYKEGQGVERDYPEAIRWLLLASWQHDEDADEQLRSIKEELHENGSLAKKAEEGDPEIQFMIGKMYESLADDPLDYGEMFKWYTYAAEQGHAESQYILGNLYSNKKGIGTAEDEARSRIWYQRAANNGHEDAAAMLDYLDNREW